LSFAIDITAWIVCVCSATSQSALSWNNYLLLQSDLVAQNLWSIKRKYKYRRRKQ